MKNLDSKLHLNFVFLKIVYSVHSYFRSTLVNGSHSSYLGKPLRRTALLYYVALIFLFCSISPNFSEKWEKLLNISEIFRILVL